MSASSMMIMPSPEVQNVSNSLTETTRGNLEGIINGGHIKAVFQPIVSLTTGDIYGYEALSRISHVGLQMNIEQMFKMADRQSKAWELEVLCRTKSLEQAVRKKPNHKLFLNVNPNILHDEKFQEGFTKGRLQDFDLDPSSIIIEITERISVTDNEVFLSAVNHYRHQQYGIALDDVGAGYSGLNVIAALRPNIMKLDMNLIRNIDKDITKKSLCQAMVDFGKNAGIGIIAEGIETEEELSTIIKLGIDYGQGYFLGMPKENFESIDSDKIKLIEKYHAKNYTRISKCAVYPIIGYLSKSAHTFPPETLVGDIYKVFKDNPTITEFVVKEEGDALGFMSRTGLHELIGGRFGYSLNATKAISQFVSNVFLRVNYNMPVDLTARLAMQRPFEQLYHPVVVEKNQKYWGLVTVKDLLNACTQVEIDAARHSNPLTGLPGNLLIEREILKRVFDDSPYCIIYSDIDNFKAYNDAYGFQNGDTMLTMIAEILKKCADRDEFVGHKI